MFPCLKKRFNALRALESCEKLQAKKSQSKRSCLKGKIADNLKTEFYFFCRKTRGRPSLKRCSLEPRSPKKSTPKSTPKKSTPQKCTTSRTECSPKTQAALWELSGRAGTSGQMIHSNRQITPQV